MKKINFKKKHSNVFYLLHTFFLATIIIVIVYNLIATTGKYIIKMDSKINSYSLDNNNSYVFYTQADADISLFPWNYYNSSNDKFLVNDNVFSFNDDYMTNEIIDIDSLYELIRYNFYQTVPNIKPKIIEKAGSLYDIMNFDNISNDIEVIFANDNYYYYYTKTLDIVGTKYNMSFSFSIYDNVPELLSFNCCKDYSDEIYTETNFDNGKTTLAAFINSDSQGYLNLLIYDIYTKSELLSNYKINHSKGKCVLDINPPYDQIYSDLKNGIYEEYYYSSNVDLSEKYEDTESEEFTVEFSYNDIVDIINSSLKLNNNSYQIVETEKDLLLILIDEQIVLHFDPIEEIFTGFNYIE